MVKSYVVNPRDYCLCLETRQGTKIYFSPANDARATLLKRGPGQLRSRLLATQRRNRELREAYERSKASYSPVFPWTNDELSCDPADILRDVVKKREGYFKVYDMSPSEAVYGLRVRGNNVEGTVSSKVLRERISSSDYGIIIKGAHLGPGEDVRLVNIEHDCRDSRYGAEKDQNRISRVACVHSAALMKHYAEWRQLPLFMQRRHPVKGTIPAAEPFNPFAFSSNWRYQSESSSFAPQNRDLAALEYDMIWEYYVHKKGLFEIDNTALHDPETLYMMLSEPMKHALASGRVTFEVIRQGFEQTDVDRSATGYLLAKIGDTFDDAGFKWNGYCLEFGDVAGRFERDDLVFNIAVRKDGLVYYTKRRKSGARPDASLVDRSNRDPFSQLGKEQQRLDDRTRTETDLYVGLPTRIKIDAEHTVRLSVPDEMKARYRSEIEEKSRRPSVDERTFGLK